MNGTRTNLFGVSLSLMGFVGVFLFYIGWGIDGLGLGATSPIKHFIRDIVFPPSKTIVPILLIAGVGACIISYFKTKRPSKITKLQIAGFVLGVLGISHLGTMIFFVRSLSS